jgi:hypothetical protein
MGPVLRIEGDMSLSLCNPLFCFVSLHKRTMSVPVESGGTCVGVEAALIGCEARLLAVTRSVVATSTGLPVNLVCGAGLEDTNARDLPPLVACGVLLSLLVVLHVVRQAWYAWGGEGAYAFPFDK